MAELSRRLYSMADAAAYLGIHEGTMRKWVSSRRIASIKLGGRRLLDVADLDRLIEAGREEATGPRPIGGDSR